MLFNQCWNFGGNNPLSVLCGQRLEIKQAADGTLDVPGLVEPHVNGFEEMWELLKSGSRVRSVGSTSANELSSRSHWYYS